MRCPYCGHTVTSVIDSRLNLRATLSEGEVSVKIVKDDLAHKKIWIYHFRAIKSDNLTESFLKKNYIEVSYLLKRPNQ